MSIKLVFYYAAIDNYYLCFGAVPKVAWNFFKPPLGQEMASFHGCILFFNSISGQTPIYTTQAVLSVVNKVSGWELCFPRNVFQGSRNRKQLCLS